MSQKLKSDVDDCWIIGYTYVLSFATKAHVENSFCPDDSYEWTEPARIRKALLKLNRGWIFERSAAKAKRISKRELSFSSNRLRCLKFVRICTSTVVYKWRSIEMRGYLKLRMLVCSLIREIVNHEKRRRTFVFLCSLKDMLLRSNWQIIVKLRATIRLRISHVKEIFKLELYT